MAKLSQVTIKKRIANKQLKINLLKGAKKHLSLEARRGICRALEYALPYNSAWDSDENKAVEDLQNYIGHALGNHSYYNDWVRDRYSKADDMWHENYPKYCKKLKNSRKAWIDWMINCLQEDIDNLKGKLNG